MPELSGHVAGWGVLPVLGFVGGVPIYAYETLVSLALIAGLALLRWDSRSEPERGSLLDLILGGLLGGAIGAKLLEWAINPALLAHLGSVSAFLAGRTILGGLLGGTLGVWLVKRRLRITERRGNLLAAPVALGLAIGRVGCFLHGCCYGTRTSLPWGVDFGDGVPRHPTQLYEVAFALVALVFLRTLRRRVVTPGRLFSGLMIGYFGFRFVEEWFRAGPRPLFGLTLYQVVAMIGLAWFLRRELRTRPRVVGCSDQPGRAVARPT